MAISSNHKQTAKFVFGVLPSTTYGTYFSCPSLEISSTSFSRRLSIAISTANPDAILKIRSSHLLRMITTVDADLNSQALVVQVRIKHGEALNSWSFWWASKILLVGGKILLHITGDTHLFKALNIVYLLKLDNQTFDLSFMSFSPLQLE